jgi:hypothetical protein
VLTCARPVQSNTLALREADVALEIANSFDFLDAPIAQELAAAGAFVAAVPPSSSSCAAPSCALLHELVDESANGCRLLNVCSEAQGPNGKLYVLYWFAFLYACIVIASHNINNEFHHTPRYDVTSCTRCGAQVVLNSTSCSIHWALLRGHGVQTPLCILASLLFSMGLSRHHHSK